MTPWLSLATPAACSDGVPGETWRALLDGRLTLVEWFDGGGRRVIVARRNRERGVRLSEVERVVASGVATGRAQKVIALDLGLSPAAVSDALARAIAKLGVSCASELARVAAALGVAPTTAS